MPGLTLVLDHGGKPPIASGDLARWAAAINAFAAQPNTVGKLSGLVTEAAPWARPTAFGPTADILLTAFGAGRLMFGSDWPVCLLAADYAAVVGLAQPLTASLPAAERDAVFAANALRAYRIGAV